MILLVNNMIMIFFIIWSIVVIQKHWNLQIAIH